VKKYLYIHDEGERLIRYVSEKIEHYVESDKDLKLKRVALGYYLENLFKSNFLVAECSRDREEKRTRTTSSIESRNLARRDYLD
jgi:hypothetical protein